MDKLIRDLLINVKQQGATKTTKAIQGIVDALEDAAVGAELANEQLAKISPTLASISSDAKKAASAMGSLGNMKNLDKMAKSLDSIEEYLDDLLTTSTTMSEKMVAGFGSVVSAVDRMGNSVVNASERAEDRLIDLNNALGKSANGLRDTDSNARRATRGLGDTSGAARGATRDFAALAQIGGTIPIMYAAIASNLYVAQAALEQFKAGDQLNRLMEIGASIGALTGTPVQTLAAALREASGYAISFEEAMKQASMASAYGFSAKQLEEFGLVARRAAAVLGVDMADALNRVIKGVSKQEVELLDELGVTIRLNDAYAKYVQVLNASGDGITYTVDKLTSYQKQQAYANAVVAESTKRFGQLDHALRATSWESFAANANTALRSLQQSAATYLSPVVDTINTIVYQTQASQARLNAMVRSSSSKQIAPDNTPALVINAQQARDELEEFEKQSKAIEERRNLVAAQLKDAKAAQTALTAPIGNALTAVIGGGDESNKLVVQLTNESARLNDELEQRTETLNALKAAVKDSNDAISRSPALVKQLGATWKASSDAIPGEGSLVIPEDKLKAASERLKDYKNTVDNVVPDVMASFDGLTKSSDLQQVASGMETVLNSIKMASDGSISNMDELTKKANVGVSSFAELEKRVNTLNSANKALSAETDNALALENKRNQLLSSGLTIAEATKQVNALEIAQIDGQIARLSDLQKELGGNKSLDEEINRLKLERIKIQNSEFEDAKKTKDISDKIVGIEEQIKQLKDTTLNSDQYAMANLQLQLQIEKQRQALLAGNAQKQRDYMQSKLNEAQIERQINELNFSQAEAASKRQREQEIAMRNATGEYTSQENLLNQINNLERERVELIKNAKDAKVALDTNRITDLQNQVMVLRQQLKTEQADKSRNFQNQATGLLGGTYSSTAGMSEGMKEMTNYLNNQQGYAEAISNLQSINSEATAAGQSLGNMVNALMQFSQGSIDTTTMVAAGMQTVSSFITMATSQQVSAIDAAIAAERARDGQSEESKAKIKKLEAEKIKVQQESAKKQILIQTAVAVMQAATSVPYPWSIPLMIAAAAAGALSYAQASSATPQLDGMSGGSGTTASLTLGKRDNSVDVSRNSSGGELSYIRGESGVGNANNFVPRAEGGNMIPGVGYITGENGIEVITPSVPSKAVPADQIGSTGKGGSAVILQVQAMDARSFVDFANENSAALRGAVEIALNENGMSLDNLSRR